MPRWFRTFTAIWAIAVISLAGWHLVRYGIERSRVSELAAEIAAGTTVPHDVATRMMERVRERVALTDKGRHYDVENRPLLRNTAWETWSWGEGQCGEGTRLLVNLLQARGIPATRINLVDAGTGYYHTPVAYEDEGGWYIVNSLDEGGPFHRWSLENQRPIRELVATRANEQGTLVIVPDNPFFSRYSFFNWARVFGDRVEINQLHPFPQWFVHVIENPPLFVGLAVLGAGGVFWLGVAWLARRREAAVRRHLSMGLRSA